MKTDILKNRAKKGGEPCLEVLRTFPFLILIPSLRAGLSFLGFSEYCILVILFSPFIA